MRNDIILEDTTLRDGEQSPGLALSTRQKVRVVEMLVALGVKWIEVGIPVMGGDEAEALEAILAYQDRVNLVAWNRGVEKDLETSLALGFRALHIGLPVSDIHLKDSIGWSRQALLDKADSLIRFAKSEGAFVSISAEDVGRSDDAFLLDYARVVREAGADRLRLSDTVGILTPSAYVQKVSTVRQAVDIDLQCHTHNDFGLAVANTLAGLEAGARYFHVTLNGIGERAGNADLASTVLGLRRLHGIDLGLELHLLTSTCHEFAEMIGHPLSAWHPVVGNNAFAHESGIHVNGMLKNVKTFEPFEPDLVGNTRRYVVGKHSGTAVIRMILEKSGNSPDKDVLHAVLEQVRTRAVGRGGLISEADVLAIYSDMAVQA